MGNKDRKYTFCGTTLFAAKCSRSARCQHTGCPLTLALRRKILRKIPVPLALGGPFAGPLFALLSALQNSLWMRFRLYLRRLRFFYVMLIKHDVCPFVKHFFSQAADRP